MNIILLTPYVTDSIDSSEEEMVYDYIQAEFDAGDDVRIISDATLSCQENLLQIINRENIDGIVYCVPHDDFSSYSLASIHKDEIPEFILFMEVTPKMTPWMKAFNLHKMKKSSERYVERFMD